MKFLLVFPLLLLVPLVYFSKEYVVARQEGEVLSQIYLEEVITPTPTPLPSPFPTSTQTPTPYEKPKLSPTPLPPPTFTSEEINGFINRFAIQYHIDPNILRHIALCESGFNPKAKKLGYAGLFQFNANTWGKYRVLMGEEKDPNLRFNGEEAVQTAAYVLSLNQAYIWPNCVP